MAGARLLATVALASMSASLAAQQVAPEEAIARQQAEIAEVVGGTCPTGTNPDDPDNVVVCGRRPAEGGPGDYRVPWAPEPGRIARLPGEAPSGRDALAADQCLRLCAQPVMIDVGKALSAIERGIDRLLHPD